MARVACPERKVFIEFCIVRAVVTARWFMGMVRTSFDPTLLDSIPKKIYMNKYIINSYIEYDIIANEDI